MPTPPTPQTALKYEAQVSLDGRLELSVLLPPGANVVVFVIPQSADYFADPVGASQTGLDFWDNPVDDDDWNNA